MSNIKRISEMVTNWYSCKYRVKKTVQTIFKKKKEEKTLYKIERAVNRGF